MGRCGEIGGISCRGEIAKRRVRTLPVVVAGPVRDLCPGMIEAEEQAFVEKLISHPTFETLAEAVLHVFARCDECQVMLCSSAQASMAFDVNSVPLSETIIPGLPR